MALVFIDSHSPGFVSSGTTLVDMHTFDGPFTFLQVQCLCGIALNWVLLINLQY
jgi:hypothetical protein